MGTVTMGMVAMGTEERRRFSIILSSKLEKQGLAIGEGAFGMVYKAEHKDWGTIALKQLKAETVQPRQQKKLVKEAEKLSELNHVNVITLYGMVTDSGVHGVVLEYMAHGALDEFVRDFDVSIPLKTQMLHGVILGMNYLHTRQPSIIHRDLKAPNVLVGTDFNVKISDFGLSEWRSFSRRTSQQPAKRCGTVTHIPPESWSDINLPANKAFDVYSFGILVWETLTEESPFSGCNEAQICACVQNGQRPRLEADSTTLPYVLVLMMQQCWHQEPTNRPNFGELKLELESQFINSQEFTSLVNRDRIELLKQVNETEGSISTIITQPSQDIYGGQAANHKGAPPVANQNAVLTAANHNGVIQNGQAHHEAYPQAHHVTGALPAVLEGHEVTRSSPPPGVIQPDPSLPLEDGGGSLRSHHPAAPPGGQPQRHTKYAVQRQTETVEEQTDYTNISDSLREHGRYPRPPPGAGQYQPPPPGGLPWTSSETSDPSSDFQPHKEKTSRDFIPVGAHEASLPTYEESEGQWRQGGQPRGSPLTDISYGDLKKNQIFHPGGPQVVREDDPRYAVGGKVGYPGYTAGGKAGYRNIKSAETDSVPYNDLPQKPASWQSSSSHQGAARPSQQRAPQINLAANGNFTTFSPLPPDFMNAFKDFPGPHNPAGRHGNPAGQGRPGPGGKPPMVVHHKSKSGTTSVINVSSVEGLQIGDRNVMYIGGATPGNRAPPGGNPRSNRGGKRNIVKGKITDSEQEVGEEHMQLMSEHVGGAWRALGRSLGFSDGQLDAIDSDFQVDGLMEKIYQLMRQWKSRQGGRATLRALANALIEANRPDVAAMLKETI